MPPASDSDPWDNPQLQDSAVDYCVSECGEPPAALRKPAGRAWVESTAARCAPRLGITPQRLAQIIHARHIAPLHVRLPTPPPCDTSPRGEEEHDAPALEDITRPAMTPGDPGDALSHLLSEESEVMDQWEREELAAALENGKPLLRDQRRLLAILLRGSSTATRADIVRALLHWLCPRLSHPAFKCHRSHRTLPPRAVIAGIPASRPLSTIHRTLNRQHLRILHPDGTEEVILHASAYRMRRRSPAASGATMWVIRSLQPAGNTVDDDSLRKNLTLLAAFIQHDNTSGKEWARTFGETPAMTSWRNKRLNKRLNQSTGGAVTLPGLRAKPDPRKGKSKPASESHAADSKPAA